MKAAIVLVLALVSSLSVMGQESAPESRTFYMGFTPWPYDFTDAALEATYTRIAEHGDLVLHHMDTGVPWREALEDRPYHPNVLANIQERIRHTPTDHRIYLSITPNAIADRNRIADYWGAEEHLPLPSEWANRPFDDPQVIQAYLNHARFMIEAFKPDYFAYGIEVTCANRGPQDEAFLGLMRFAAAVYPALKSEYPDLPIFLTICAISTERTGSEALEEANRQITLYSDYIGLSIYPYLLMSGIIELTGKADASLLPDDFLSRWAALDLSKPFAVTETGYIAEDLVMQELSIDIAGTSESQRVYMERLLRAANDLEAEFVVWFVVQDYDAAVRTMEDAGLSTTAALIWRDTGLFDDQGSPRPAFAVWAAWLQRPHRLCDTVDECPSQDR